ncbi:hypothetical protein D3C79_1028200 [compost metagenome]
MAKTNAIGAMNCIPGSPLFFVRPTLRKTITVTHAEAYLKIPIAPTIATIAVQLFSGNKNNNPTRKLSASARVGTPNFLLIVPK